MKLETALKRYRWACEELLMDALYQQLNRRSSRGKQVKFLRRAYGVVPDTEDVYDACEVLTLYYFSALRESTLDMVEFLLQYFECDHNALASMINSIAGTQDGRRKTLGLGLEDKPEWQPKKKNSNPVEPGTKQRKTNRYLF